MWASACVRVNCVSVFHANVCIYLGLLNTYMYRKIDILQMPLHIYVHFIHTCTEKMNRDLDRRRGKHKARKCVYLKPPRSSSVDEPAQPLKHWYSDDMGLKFRTNDAGRHVTALVPCSAHEDLIIESVTSRCLRRRGETAALSRWLWLGRGREGAGREWERGGEVEAEIDDV